MANGSIPADGGNLILTRDEKNDLLRDYLFALYEQLTAPLAVEKKPKKKRGKPKPIADRDESSNE